ncbi:MAG: hypothetical protein ACLSH8_00950 [Zhenhengia sp.]
MSLIKFQGAETKSSGCTNLKLLPIQREKLSLEMGHTIVDEKLDQIKLE